MSTTPVDYAHPAGTTVAGTRRRRDTEETVPSLRRLVAEIFGAYILTLSSIAPDVLAKATGATFSDPVKAVMPGMAVALVIYAVGDVSGAHLNPAVTIAFWLRRVFPGARVPGYIAAQLVGALLAGFTLRARYGSAGGLGVNTPKTDAWTSFVCEIVLTAILVIVILNVATKEQLIGPQAALPVAFVITLDGLLGLHLSGASMNPARSIGPALVAGHYGHLAIYVVGPILGACIGLVLTWLLHGRCADDERLAAQGEQ